ncbi:hypothetical protein JKP88DRAFT_244828 [Tribonema minus]|uniref:Uncharacterized protein n=1 Tax=Tribonema minus TaxID=303371 RepID=A0A836CHJ7_9STRA|nr:hypothetical protein JKP88DRAFT_244828 [Tribonema minus]
MAEMYRLGQYPHLRPDSDMAIRLYEAMLTLPLQRDMKDGIHCALQSLIPDVDVPRDAINMPRQPGLTVTHHLLQQHEHYCRVLMRYCAQARAWESHVENEEHVAAERRGIDDRVATLAALRGHADRHNVHNSTVVSATREAIAALMEEYYSSSSFCKTRGRWKLALRLCTYRSLWRHMSSITVVMLSLGTYSNAFGWSERDLLNAVVTKINQQEDSELRHSLMESLGLALASALEEGTVVCHTGKMVRIVSVLRYLELANTTMNKPLAHMTPELRHEALTLAAVVRNEWLRNQDVEDRSKYEKGDKTLAAQVRELYLQKLSSVYEELVEPVVLETLQQESAEFF